MLDGAIANLCVSFFVCVCAFVSVSVCLSSVPQLDLFLNCFLEADIYLICVVKCAVLNAYLQTQSKCG